MDEKKEKKLLCVDDLRHAEYYNMQDKFDELYINSKNGVIFDNLMELILSRENILLAYRNIKTNAGSKTAGTDGLTIKDIGRLTPDMVIDKVNYIVKGSPHGYRPRSVRRKNIPKPNGDFRPLGIPCIWDRLIQQCIKQVMEPICEAKFSEHSYGFRPNRSVENAIAETYFRLQQCHLHYVIEFDIQGFFDNVNHSKLIKQIWALGIRDKHLIYVIKKILKAPIKMENGEIVHPDKGTPQGGIISPLLANIVLNELDQWIESEWEMHPVTEKYAIRLNSNGSLNRGHGYRAMRKTRLKEIWIVRYADDFRIFCSNKKDAVNTKIAITDWLETRLKLKVSPDKTRIVNAKKKYAEFLGFKIKVHPKGEKYVVKSHISDRQMERKKEALLKQIDLIKHPRPEKEEFGENVSYNLLVVGLQNYYQIATCVHIDCERLQWAVSVKLKSGMGNRLKRNGRRLSKFEYARYGDCKQLRYLKGVDEPIYPVGYVKCRKPLQKKKSVCCYTREGRNEIHDNLRINVSLLHKLMRQPLYGNSIEFADNRISLFSEQWGKCAVTHKSFISTSDIHCHHKVPKAKGGSDKYENLILVLEPVHRLIHATDKGVINKYLNLLNLSNEQLEAVNKLRVLVGNNNI